MSPYVAANGQELTDEMIDRWCESYERGEFPEGERTVAQASLVTALKKVGGVPRAHIRRAERASGTFARAQGCLSTRYSAHLRRRSILPSRWVQSFSAAS